MTKLKFFAAGSAVFISSFLLVACGGYTSASNTAASAPWVGTKTLGVAGAAVATPSVSTYMNSVYVAGTVSGNLNGQTRTGNLDTELSKFDSSGSRVWTTLMGAVSGSTYGYAVASSSAGNFITGTATRALSGNVQTGSTDAYVAKIDSNGTVVWIRQFGAASANLTGYAVAVSADSVYVIGATDHGLGGNTQVGTIDLFVTKFDLSGTQVWMRQLGAASGTTFALSVGIDGSGVYIAGQTDHGLDGNAQIGTLDTFITKYDLSGTKLWTRQIGVAGQALIGYSIAVNSTGVFVAGATTGGYDGHTLTGTTDAYIVKFDLSGAKLWSRQFGVASSDVRSFAVAATDQAVYISGSATGAVNGSTVYGTYDVFLNAFDLSGTSLWGRQYGGTAATAYLRAMTTDGTSIFVSGTTNKAIDQVPLIGVSDTFVTKFDASGTKQ